MKTNHQENTPNTSLRNIFDIESDFNHQKFIAEGVTGLLFSAANNDTLDDLNKSQLVSAIYAADTANFTMGEIFDELSVLYRRATDGGSLSEPADKATPKNTLETLETLNTLNKTAKLIQSLFSKIKSSCNEAKGLTRKKAEELNVLFDSGIKNSENLLNTLDQLSNNPRA